MSKLIELVREYGSAKYCEGEDDNAGFDSRQSTEEAAAILSELRTRLEALERDAARFQHLQNIDPKEAQAYFWTYSSRTERRKAIDAAMEAAK